MKHPEILLLPVLMIADYQLTLAGAVLAERRYSEHFRVMSYELNPIWRQSVAKRRWWNPRHLALVALVSAVLIGSAESGLVPAEFWGYALGALFSVFACIVGRHVSNIFIFRYVLRSPGSISGTVEMSQRLLIKISQYQMIAILGPLLLIAVFTGTDFAVGAVAGIVLAMSVHSFWHRREARHVRRSGEDSHA